MLRVRKRARNGESEPAPANVGWRSHRAVERLEDLRFFAIGDTDTAIEHEKLEIGIDATGCELDHRAARRILGGVLEQIHDDA